MRNVLIVGARINSNEAVSNIIYELIKLGNNSRFYLIAFGSEKLEINNNIMQIKLEDKRNSFFNRLIRKIQHILKIDDYRLGTNQIYNVLKKECKNIKFDYIISASGPFYYTCAAYKYAKKNNTKMKIIYFDPFVDNYNCKNKRKRLREENKWLQYVEDFFYNEENKSPVNKNSKFIPFKIPLYNMAKNPNNETEDYFMYGGTFYKGIREADNIYLLADKILNSKYKIKCYSNINNPNKHKKIEFGTLLNYNNYLDRCYRAKALIYIGNCGSNSVSSKYLEFISLKKIIIGINVDKNDEVRKYPFYFDYDEMNLIEKIESIDENIISNYNPYNTYMDRDPRKLFERFFD